MTKAHYWYIFGKPYMPPDYQTNRLEIDRSIVDWPRKLKAQELGFGKIEELVFDEVKNKKGLPGRETFLLRTSFFPKLKTDETLFEAQIIYQNGDSLLPGTILFETVSKYSTYDWKYYPLVTQKKSGDTDTLKVSFNVPRINHRKDQIHISVYNPGKKGVIIHSLKIKALSLIRN